MSTDLAYVAGFFDGEGCITARVTKDGYSRLRVQITQRDAAPLIFIQQRFGGQVA